MLCITSWREALIHKISAAVFKLKTPGYSQVRRLIWSWAIVFYKLNKGTGVLVVVGCSISNISVRKYLSFETQSCITVLCDYFGVENTDSVCVPNSSRESGESWSRAQPNILPHLLYSRYDIVIYSLLPIVQCFCTPSIVTDGWNFLWLFKQPQLLFSSLSLMFFLLKATTVSNNRHSIKEVAQSAQSLSLMLLCCTLDSMESLVCFKGGQCRLGGGSTKEASSQIYERIIMISLGLTVSLKQSVSLPSG